MSNVAGEEMNEDHARGLHLNDKQIVFSVMAATVVAVIVFLCGVFVGRGVQAFRPAGEQALADARVVPDATPPTTEADAGAAVGGDVNSGAVPPENLTYPDRLTKLQLPVEALPAGDNAPPVPDDGPDDSAADAAARTPSPAPASSPAPGTKAGSTVSPAPGSVAGTGADAASADSESLSGNYTVQVFAVRRRGEAQDMVAVLKKKGFAAYVFTPPPGDPRGGFRVRVGSFKTRQEAAAMAARLQKEKYQPWITR